MALTEDDIRRIVREEIERARVMPIYTAPQPVPPGWPMMTPLWPSRPCPNGCKPFTACGNVACPLRMQIT